MQSRMFQNFTTALPDIVFVESNIHHLLELGRSNFDANKFNITTSQSQQRVRFKEFLRAFCRDLSKLLDEIAIFLHRSPISSTFFFTALLVDESIPNVTRTKYGVYFRHHFARALDNLIISVIEHRRIPRLFVLDVESVGSSQWSETDGVHQLEDANLHCVDRVQEFLRHQSPASVQ
jgi:hypothetical protein